MSLGIIDWGIGGVSIYKLIKERRPETPIVYFSDTGATPYGKMSRSDLIDRLNTAITFLQERGITRLVIGCNAASTAIPFLELNGLKTEGVIDAAIETTAKLNPKRLGLIGGRRTVLSGIYRRGFADLGISVEQRVAQPLSGLIESGDVGSQTLHSECRRILAPLKNCSHILLARTHYPAITDVLREYVSAKTEFVDPASALVARISGWKIKHSGPDVFLTTGDAESMTKAARAAFDCKLTDVKKVSLRRV